MADRLTRDDKYIFLNGERVAVFTEGLAPRSIADRFVDMIDGDFATVVAGAEPCDHADEIKCRHCGRLTPTGEGKET
jgi:hypothetical protein